MSDSLTDSHRMPYQWKRSLAGATFIAVQLALAGCGGGDGGSPAQPPDNGGGQTPPPVSPPPVEPPPVTPPLVCDDALAETMAASLPTRATQTEYVDQLVLHLHERPYARTAAPAEDARIGSLIRRVERNWNARTRSPHANGEDVGALSIGVARSMSGGAVVLSLNHRMPVERARTLAAMLADEPEVRFAEPDLRLHATVAPSDPDYGRQWNLFETAGGIRMPEAWSLSTGSAHGVTAVIDTGVLPHADLAARLLPGYTFITNPLTANNGVGRSPDASDAGDWITQQELDDPSGAFYQCAGAPMQSSWHGTRVAGVIGAGANNGIGVAGIDWQGKILPVRVLGKCGGATSDIADGMRWAAGLRVDGVPDNPHPASVLNLSLGGVGPCGSTFQDAIDDVVAAGAVVVVAAGNDGASAEHARPANCRGVITVASSDRGGLRVWDSNYGKPVALSAPGAAILSTANGGATTPGADAYLPATGTSFAAPQVSGVIALMLAKNPTLTPAQISTLLRQTARPSPQASTAPSCLALPPGAGILDAAAAVSSAKR